MLLFTIWRYESFDKQWYLVQGFSDYVIAKNYLEALNYSGNGKHKMTILDSSTNPNYQEAN